LVAHATNVEALGRKCSMVSVSSRGLRRVGLVKAVQLVVAYMI
jgi:hypothetical protein